ncbi:hypothetical protein HMP0721_0248 [Pseudoramibacter alactolyticus ATCC 23263]|uniref:Uncharacterized protein n=1 Tax=Pseudoramibacter alactolyticus ATCC 23263 TaxID=887929 RepID=E6ME15_9FIRM|nr:hypothetical protein HMP0721_0248 [Pseudoramibacter alactolyticus ATCC 23263]
MPLQNRDASDALLPLCGASFFAGYFCDPSADMRTTRERRDQCFGCESKSRHRQGGGRLIFH